MTSEPDETDLTVADAADDATDLNVAVGATTSQPDDSTGSTKPASDVVHLVPGTIVGEYEIERLLGSGGMGSVYGARHDRLGRRAAIKVIAPNLSADTGAVERFEQEALALAKLCHPNIVSVLSIGTLPGDGRSYYIMEWLDGEALYDRLSFHRGPVPRDEALDIIDQIARGLSAAHAAGIVHRDLKPDNVWLQEVADDPRRIVRILDFGLAKLAQHRRSEETSAGAMFGTPGYASPEQSRSSRDVGPPTDVYALGCIAYELLCGRLPFEYESLAEQVAAHASEEPPTPRSLNPTLPLEIDALLEQMLAKDPARRPILAQVRQVIAAARSTPPIIPVASRHPTAQDTWTARSMGTRRLTIAIATAAIAALIVTVLGVTRRPQPKQGNLDAAIAAPLPAARPAATIARPDAAATAPPTPRPRSTGSGDRPAPAPPRSPKTGSAAIVTAVVPVDAGIDAKEEDLAPPPEKTPPRAKSTAPPHPIDRNQTINPFAKKHKVIP